MDIFGGLDIIAVSDSDNYGLHLGYVPEPVLNTIRGKP